MIIGEFLKPDLKRMNWKQVFDVYDENFRRIRNIFVSLGDKFIIEKVTPVNGLRLYSLKNTYEMGKHQLSIYYNGVRQWEGIGFEERSLHSFELKFDPKSTDEIMAVILTPAVGVGDSVEDFFEEIVDLVTDLTERFEILDARVGEFSPIGNIISVTDTSFTMEVVAVYEE